MMRRKFGLVHVALEREYNLDEFQSGPAAGLLLVLPRLVFGFTLSRPRENPYVRLYAGVGSAEIYYDRDRSWED
jgi:hypothetical protein